MNFLRKMTLSLCLTAAFGSLALAEEDDGNRVISDRVVSMDVNISAKNIVRSRADYSSLVLKINVDELADHTFLNHRNTAANGPCLATYDAQTPGQIIQGKPGIETIDVRIKLEKSVYADTENNVCKVSMTETVTTNIRGFQFYHTKSAQMPDRLLADCR